MGGGGKQGETFSKNNKNNNNEDDGILLPILYQHYPALCTVGSRSPAMKSAAMPLAQGSRSNSVELDPKSHLAQQTVSAEASWMSLKANKQGMKARAVLYCWVLKPFGSAMVPPNVMVLFS